MTAKELRIGDVIVYKKFLPERKRKVLTLVTLFSQKVLCVMWDYVELPMGRIGSATVDCYLRQSSKISWGYFVFREGTQIWTPEPEEPK